VIFIYDPDTYSKILEIEGENWISGGGRAMSPYDFETVLNSWKNRFFSTYYAKSIVKLRKERRLSEAKSE